MKSHNHFTKKQVQRNAGRLYCCRCFSVPAFFLAYNIDLCYTNYRNFEKKGSVLKKDIFLFKHEGIFFVNASQLVASDISLATNFFISLQSSSCAHSAAPLFKNATALLVCVFVSRNYTSKPVKLQCTSIVACMAVFL